jgi:hypothetical protein
MKKIYSLLAALVLAMSSFTASAATAGMSPYASGDGWKQFEAALVADKLMVAGSDSFKTIGLSNVMYNGLSDAQKASLNRVAFDRLNKMVNNLDETIKVSNWPQIAGNLKLPDVQVVAQAAPVATPAPAPVAAAQPAAPVAESLDTKAMAIMNGKVEALQKALNKPGASPADVAANAALVKGLQAQVATLKAGQSAFASKPEYEAFIASVDSRIDSALKRFDALEAGLKEADTKAQTALDQSGDARTMATAALQTANDAKAAAGGTSPWTWVALAGSALAILLALLAGVATRGKATKTEVVAVMKRQSDAEENVDQIRSDLSDLDVRVKAVEGKRQVVFPDNFDKKVDSLTAANPSYEFSVSVEGETETAYALRITKREEGGYNINGLKDVTTEVGRKGLRKAIGNAAAVIDGKSRLVGLVDTKPPVAAEKPSCEEIPDVVVPDHIPAFLHKRA